MILYVAKRRYDYEGYEVLGIFDSPELAQAVCDKDGWLEKDGTIHLYGDSHSVDEYILNKGLQ